MSLRNKLAIVSFTLMSLMTIPTLAENDNAPVTSRIEDALHTVEIKVPEGWQETKSFELIPEAFEFDDCQFQGVKFKNGTEQHGCAIFFASTNEDAEISEEALLQAHAQVQDAAFPGMKPSQLFLVKFDIKGALEGDSYSEDMKINVAGSVEAHLSQTPGNPYLKVTGKSTIDTVKNCAIGTGRVSLGNDNTQFSGTTGVIFEKNYRLIILSWGADEALLEKDLNVFKDAIAITPKPAKAQPVATEIQGVVATGEIAGATVVAEPVAIIEENQQVAAPAEPAPAVAAVEEKSDAAVTEAVIAVEDHQQVAAPAEAAVASLEQKNDTAPVAAVETTTESAVTVETLQAAASSEPVSTAEIPA
ncbi:MAG: hypothetical protein JSS10_05795 [Verrucomicrobia bacterium]|nr:hypothetical protein [Verrucomicrobiota bacterium]